MAPRPKMDLELVQINDKVTEMTEMVEEAIVNSIKAIKDKDMLLARRIIDADEHIDDMDDEINEMCYLFLATQQPVASDLRYCISIMKMVTDLERIGDHCSNIAVSVLEERDEKLDRHSYINELKDEGAFNRLLKENLEKYRLPVKE